MMKSSDTMIKEYDDFSTKQTSLLEKVYTDRYVYYPIPEEDTKGISYLRWKVITADVIPLAMWFTKEDIPSDYSKLVPTISCQVKNDQGTNLNCIVEEINGIPIVRKFKIAPDPIR